MTDALKMFAPGNVTGMLTPLLMSWLIWPVLCGILGAKKGLGLRGWTHGLFWGPIGLLLVFFSKQKHVCPTCGQRTLLHPAAQPALAIAPPMALPSTPTAAPKESCDGTPAAPADRITSTPMSPQERNRVLEEACAGYSEEEKTRLYAWVNGK